MTTRFQILDTGCETTQDDPKRGVWYATSDLCSYWTDDWSTLTKICGGIPACPSCGCVGMMMDYEKWLEGASVFERTHPYYIDFMLDRKEQCSMRMMRWMAFYKLFVEMRENELKAGNGAKSK